MQSNGSTDAVTPLGTPNLTQMDDGDAIRQSRCSGDRASGWGYPLGASSPLVRQAMSPPIQDYGTLAAARKHCEPLLKATPTVRLQATRDKQNSSQPSSRTPDSVHLVVGTTQWSAPRSPQNETHTVHNAMVDCFSPPKPLCPGQD